MGVTETRSPDQYMVPGADGAELAVADWPGSRGALVCVHGLTSHSRAFAGLATELREHRILAIDCRGRGQSSAKGPFGLTRHADDLAAAIDSRGVERATVVGHSMGSYIAGAFAARYPDRVERLVFVDGGYPQDVPAGVTPDQLLDASLALYLTKLRRSWTNLNEYVAFYEQTPVYSNGVDIYGRAHFGYDLIGKEPEMRARVSMEAVRDDWRELLDREAVGARLEAVTVPLLLIRAPGGLTGTGDEVVTDHVRDIITAKVPKTLVVDVPGTNHHTILLSVPGARAVARAIEEFTR